jgi:hypothetical protein
VDTEARNPRQQSCQKEVISRDFAEPSDGLEPSTPSLPSRDHARSSETQFSLEIDHFVSEAMGRQASRVSFLMCPFCVRVVSPG